LKVAALSLSLSLVAGPALAEPPPDPDAEANPGTERAPASDARAGHPILHAGFGLLAPVGRLAAGLPASDYLRSGPAVTGSIGIGLGRNAVLEAGAGYGSFAGSTACPLCSGRSIDAGIGLTYHLSQGFAIDPWLRYGLALRWTNLDLQTNLGTDAVSYRGIDIAKLGLGADFYPTPMLGLGPFLEADLGTNYRRPAPLAGEPVRGLGTYAFLQIGLRVSLDPLKPSLREPKKKSARAAAFLLP
jgi:hypothetical protein